MGAANCRVTNETDEPIIVMTFNHADQIFTYFHQMYVIPPGESREIKAAADAWGMSVTISYLLFGKELRWRRWFVKNGGHLILHAKCLEHMRASGHGMTDKGIGRTNINSDTAILISNWTSKDIGMVPV